MAHHREESRHDPATHGFAKGLGWFSIGLGLVEIMSPKTITRALGMEAYEPLVVGYGLRELATGVGILSAKDPTPWIWGRVAGDAVDIATVIGATRRHVWGEERDQNVTIALAALAGVTALDVLCARTLSSENEQYDARLMEEYRGRSGFRSSPQAVRGAAREALGKEGFGTPQAMRAFEEQPARPSIGLGHSARAGDALH